MPLSACLRVAIYPPVAPACVHVACGANKIVPSSNFCAKQIFRENYLFAPELIIEKGILNISAFNYVCLAYFVYAMIYPTEHGLIMR